MSKTEQTLYARAALIKTSSLFFIPLICIFLALTGAEVALAVNITPPNDPSWSDQNAFTKIKLIDGWAYTKSTDNDVIIAVLDDGVAYDHPNLAANVWTNTGEIPNNNIDDDSNGYVDDVYGWDFGNGDNNPLPDGADSTHGTAVASVFGAVTNNSLSIAGMSYYNKLKIMSLKITPSLTYNEQKTNVSGAIKYAVDNGARIINISYSIAIIGDPNPIKDAILYAYNKGCVITVTANSGSTQMATLNEVVSVAAVNSNDDTVVPSPISEYDAMVDVCAPGTNIYVDTFPPEYSPSIKSGSSLSAPMVAGLVGLIWSAYPDWSRDEVVNRVFNTADNIDSLNPGYEGKLGTGRINAYRALKGDFNPVKPRIPQGPTLGNVGTHYTYDTFSVDAGADKMKIIFDWGDGTTTETEYFDSGAIVRASHKWSSADIYSIKAKAVDIGGTASVWSDSLNVNISDSVTGKAYWSSTQDGLNPIITASYGQTVYMCLETTVQPGDVANFKIEEVDPITNDDVDNIFYTIPGDILPMPSPIIPNDPEYSKQWALPKINAPEAWNITNNSTEVVVAVVDTGVDYTHPDLSDNIWIKPGEDINHNGVVDDSDINGIDDDNNGYVDDIRGWNFFYGDNDPMDHDIFFAHGTSVSGIIAAITNNGLGMAGMSYGNKIKIMPVKVHPNLLYGRISTAIKYAADNGARVINISAGTSLLEKGEFEEAVDYAFSKGCAIILAAGNSNNYGVNPDALLNNVLGVAGLDSNNKKEGYSSYDNLLDVSAPGQDIYTTVPGGNYDYELGTSFAAPFVSGLAALILSKHPELTNQEVMDIIKNSTDSIDHLNPLYAGKLGTGRINAYKALLLADGQSLNKTLKLAVPWKVNWQHDDWFDPLHLADPPEFIFKANVRGVSYQSPELVLAPGAPEDLTSKVTVNISQGEGSIDVYKNNTLLSTVSSTQTFDFNIGDTLKLAATSATGWLFAGFVDEFLTIATATPLETTVDNKDLVYDTYFEPKPYSFEVKVVPQDTGTVSVVREFEILGSTSTSQTFYAFLNDIASFTAQAKAGYTFNGWYNRDGVLLSNNTTYSETILFDGGYIEARFVLPPSKVITKAVWSKTPDGGQPISQAADGETAYMYVEIKDAEEGQQVQFKVEEADQLPNPNDDVPGGSFSHTITASDFPSSGVPSSASVSPPNDPTYNLQWHLVKIEAVNGWAYTRDTDKEVVVAVIDSGINYDEPDLTANIWTNTKEIAGNGIDDDNNGYVDDVHGWNFRANNGDVTDSGESGHGTMSASIIAAVTNNDLKIVGMSYYNKLKVMPLKILDDTGQVGSFGMAEAIRYAADNGAKVINYAYSSNAFQAFADIVLGITYAVDKGCVFVCSAGNNNEDIGSLSLASYDIVLSVAGTDKDDKKVSDSNYGEDIKISAPGYSIPFLALDGGVAGGSGTSMAAPIVSGLAGLLFSVHPDWNREQVIDQILYTADNIDALNPGYEGKLGAGRINVYRALSMPPRIKYAKFSVPWNITWMDDSPWGDPEFIFRATLGSENRESEELSVTKEGLFPSIFNMNFEIMDTSLYLVGNYKISPPTAGTLTPTIYNIPDEDLFDGIKYYWNVTAENAARGISPVSQTWMFMAAP